MHNKSRYFRDLLALSVLNHKIAHLGAKAAVPS